MSFRCFFVVSSIFIWSMMPSSPASAQTMPGQWHGDFYSVTLISEMPPSMAHIDEKNAIDKIIPHVSKAGTEFIHIGTTMHCTR